MWTYEQSTGRLTHDGLPIGVGYSGHGIGKNNPSFQNTWNIGPIPCGRYLIGSPITDPKTGPYTLGLTPNPNNEMFGRSGFRIHGDSELSPGNGSDGCIVLSLAARQEIRKSGDYSLTVVSGT